MAIVFAGIAPHPPVLIPEIGGENIKKISLTQQALVELEQSFYLSKPDSVVVISSHGEIYPDSFNINLNANYSADFKEFGNFSVEFSFRSDYMTIQQIRAADENNRTVPISLSSNEKIDHGVSIPLYYLTKHLKNIPIIPISCCGLNYQSHFDFGVFLYRQLSKIDKRFAIVSSGDLSHKLTKDAPGGYNKDAVIFDQDVVGKIANHDIKGIIEIDPKKSSSAGECGLRPISVLLGVVSSLNVKPEILSYEGPFGVGYMVGNYRFS